ncbi:MAG: hypothetical protein K6B65_02250 [Bacilli bacterium]|nr:hypothetical protein [Bacilli bacterium]
MKTTTMTSNPLLELASKPGYEGLKDWALTLEKIGKKKQKFGGSLVLPNYFLSSMDGYDMDLVLEALEGTLINYGLFSFTSSVNHYCLSLDYSYPTDQRFSAFNDLFSAVEDELGRFGTPFQGILMIDITDWVEKGACTERKFLDFLRYMSDLDERTLAIYLDRSGSEGKSNKAKSTIITKTRIEYLELKLKSPQIALQILKNELKDLGFTLKKETREPMLSALEEVLKVEGQEGPWTMRQLAQDIAYAAFKEGEGLPKEIDEILLKPFLHGGSWLSEFAAKKSFYMGLIGD